MSYEWYVLILGLFKSVAKSKYVILITHNS